MTTSSARIYTLPDARNDHPLWFERGAMRFFGTRIHENRVGPGCCYLVTSESPPRAPRTWNVRRFTPTQCDTIGPSITEGWGSHKNALRVAETLRDLERDGHLVEFPDRSDTYRPCGLCLDPRPSWASYTLNGVPVCGRHAAATLLAGSQS
jgi:hypothetical protein